MLVEECRDTDEISANKEKLRGSLRKGKDEADNTGRSSAMMWAESTIVCDVESAVSKLKSHEHVEVTSGWGRFQCELEKYGPTTDVQLLKRVESDESRMGRLLAR